MIERSRLAGRCMECLEHVWPRKNIKATQRNQNHPRSALEPPIPTPKTIEEQLLKHRSTSSSSKNHQNHPRSAQATIEPTEPPQAPLKPHQIPLSVTNTNPDLPSIYPEPHRTSITGKKKIANFDGLNNKRPQTAAKAKAGTGPLVLFTAFDGRPGPLNSDFKTPPH